MTKSKLIIIFIFIVAIFLRVWNLNNVPPHLTPDEAALGYNAYSILKTGRDEHGKFMPLVFKSFGDYKPGLYIYSTVPFVAVFGLNEWSVRLPSAIFGILAVYLLYLIASILFPDNKIFKYIITLVAATNPWLIYFSRGAWEVNMSLFLTLGGIYFFIRSLKENIKLFYSVIFFGLSLLAYQGAKLSTGIVILILMTIYWKDFWNVDKKVITKSAFVGLLLSLPIIFSLFTGQTGRLEVFSVFSYPRSREYIQTMLDEGSEKIGSLSYYSYHSEALNFARGVLGRYFNHFSSRFFLFEGDWSNPRHSAPYQGVLLLSDVLGLIAGIIYIVRNYIQSKKSFSFLVMWLMLSPLPAVLSRDQVHAVRSLNMAIPLIFVIGFGFSYIINSLSKQKMSILYMSLVLIFYIASIVYFVDAYFIHLPRHSSKLWEYGYKQIVQTITPIQYNYKKIVVQQSFAQPYIYFLFFNKYDPSKYQKENSYIPSEYKLDVGYVTKIDNIYFEAIDWSRNRGDHGSLFVADTLRIPPLDSNDEREFRLIKEIKYLDNLNTAFRIIEIKNK